MHLIFDPTQMHRLVLTAKVESVADSDRVFSDWKPTNRYDYMTFV